MTRPGPHVLAATRPAVEGNGAGDRGRLTAELRATEPASPPPTPATVAALPAAPETAPYGSPTTTRGVNRPFSGSLTTSPAVIAEVNAPIASSGR